MSGNIMHPGIAGLGMHKYQRPGSRWQPCHERLVDGCPTTLYGGGQTYTACCKTAVCYLCITHVCDGNTEQVIIPWDPVQEAYSGVIYDDVPFLATMEKDPDGSCNFYVYVDDVLEAVFPACYTYGEQSVGCRDPEATFEWTYNGGSYPCTGDLEFKTIKPKRLRRVKNPYECAEPFCGSSECTCDEMCVLIITNSRAIWTDCYTEGTLTWAATDECELGATDPMWSGEGIVCGDLTFDISVTLERRVNEETGVSECWFILNATDTNEGIEFTQEQAAYTTYEGLSLTFTLEEGPIYDPSTVSFTIRCNVCGQCGFPSDIDGCCDFNLLGFECPTTMGVGFCDVSGDISLADGGGCSVWSGSIDANGETVDITVSCTEGGPNEELGLYELAINCNSQGPNPVYTYADPLACSPFIILFDVNFTCPGVCEDASQPIQVVVSAADLVPLEGS